MSTESKDLINPPATGRNQPFVSAPDRRAPRPDREAVVSSMVDSLLSLDPADRMPAVMALANAALPDSSPRRITRDQVNVLRLLRARANEHDVASWSNLLELDRLIETLDALLPPEATDSD